MSDKENTYFTVRLGEFNTKSTIDGRRYNINEDDLRKKLDALKDKPIGEINVGGLDGMLSGIDSMEDRLRRYSTIELQNFAGVLRDYDIAHTDEGGLLVTGHVDFSSRLQQTIDNLADTHPTFGVRALCNMTSPDMDCNILNVISFDYVDPTRRLNPPK